MLLNLSLKCHTTESVYLQNLYCITGIVINYKTSLLTNAKINKIASILLTVAVRRNVYSLLTVACCPSAKSRLGSGMLHITCNQCNSPSYRLPSP